MLHIAHLESGAYAPSIRRSEVEIGNYLKVKTWTRLRHSSTRSGEEGAIRDCIRRRWPREVWASPTLKLRRPQAASSTPRLRRARRGRDSNPRYPFEYTHFPGVLLQPLGHLSRWLTAYGRQLSARKEINNLSRFQVVKLSIHRPEIHRSWSWHLINHILRSTTSALSLPLLWSCRLR